METQQDGNMANVGRKQIEAKQDRINFIAKTKILKS